MQLHACLEPLHVLQLLVGYKSTAHPVRGAGRAPRTLRAGAVARRGETRRSALRQPAGTDFT